MIRHWNIDALPIMSAYIAVVDMGPVGNFIFKATMFLAEWFWMIAPVIGIVLGAVIFRLVREWYKGK